MFSNHKTINRSLALTAFFASLILYCLTLAPTTSFWDSGEFIAVAHGLEVNHPPGAPFYSLLGRIFSMFMPAYFVAVSINFISALTSALTVMLLYLIIVRLVREWKGNPDNLPVIDRIGLYGGALLGAFSFAVTDTFWFSAVEAEVYAVSIFFTALVVWLALKWSEYHNQPNNERWLVLIAYMFGLALGVHLLNLLALFFVALIIYFKKKEFELLSISVTGVIAVISFGMIYPFTIQMLPSIMESVVQASYGLIGPLTFSIILTAFISWGIYFTHKNKYRTANIVILCYAMILIGYSSYSLIFIRSLADPPIDENDPETIESFISYLEREQYGSTPLLTGYTYDNSKGRVNEEEEVFFPRRYSARGMHMQQYQNYESDWDYFINYQVNHMYIRYFNWNFIGRDSDIQDASWQSGFTDTPNEENPAHNSYFYIPFLIGLFGMIFHFQKDWKRALSLLVLFIMTGLAIIVFLNQTPMQPRERDYAYVGSFFAFAIWIGMGGVGFIEMVKEFFKSNTTVAYGMMGILLIATPGVMGYQNFDDHDRSGRYVASDYAYNLLQSAAPNSILFTNGDNDTFPLWYLQEVEGVRTDVRVVCLSLLNTDWYIKQLRDQWSHESAPLPISLNDKEVEQITSSLSLHQPDTVTIPVNKDLLQSAFSEDQRYKESIGVKPDTALNLYSKGVDFRIPVDSLDNEVKWYFEGRPAGRDQQGNRRFYTQVQDEVILDILKTNKWLRPIYFANSVSTSSQLDLQPYFRFEGKAFRVVPKRHEPDPFGGIDPEIHAEKLRKFRFREWDNPDVYFDENIRRMLGNYRLGITELADTYLEEGKPDSASKWLKWGEERIPFNKLDGSQNSKVLYAYSYAKAGDSQNALRLLGESREEILDELRFQIGRFDDLQSELSRLQQEADEARQNANLGERQQIQGRMQNLSSRNKRITQDIYSAVSQLIIVQRIYYMFDKEEPANTLIEAVNQITTSRIQFPQNKEENKEQFDRFQL